MELLAKWIILAMLVIVAVFDLRTKEVPLIVLVAVVVVSTAVSLFCKDLNLLERFLGGFLGIILLCFNKLTRGALGAADGIIFIGIGAYCGIIEGIAILFYALVLTAIVSVGLLLVHKLKRKDTIPFLPFVLISYIGVWLV